MTSLMMYFVERDMDDQAREKLRYSLENPTFKKAKTVQAPTKGKIVPLDPTKRWRAPDGWTPPGWSEEKSYASAQSFIAFQRSPK